MPTAWPAAAASRIRATVSARPPMSGAGRSVPYSIVLRPYDAAGFADRTFFTKPFRKTRLMALPLVSGPREKKNVALTLSFSKRSTRRGTPSSVPRYVSTSTLRASFKRREACGP
jgi:hypothetical protein